MADTSVAVISYYLPTNPSGKLHVLCLYSDSLCVDGTQGGIFHHANHVSFNSFLKSVYLQERAGLSVCKARKQSKAYTHRSLLEPYVGLEVLC